MSIVIPLFASENNADDDESTSDFERFWALYPRRIGKGAARVAFARALRVISAAELLAAVERYAQEPRELRFTPYPATFLNQERWADETPAPPLVAVKPDPPMARIPAPRSSCENCEHGFIWLEDGSVKRCDHAG